MPAFRCWWCCPEVWCFSSWYNYQTHDLQCWWHHPESWCSLSPSIQKMHNFQCWWHLFQSLLFSHSSSDIQGLDCHHRCNLSSLLCRWWSACRRRPVSRSGCFRSSKYSLFPKRYYSPDNNSHRNSQGLFPLALIHYECMHFCDWEQEW